MSVVLQADRQLTLLAGILPESDDTTEIATGSSIAVLWVRRMLETGRAALLLQRRGFGHTAAPLDRLMVELLGHVAWLARAERPDLAVRAVRAEAERQQALRFESFLGHADDLEPQLPGAIDQCRKRQADLSAVSEQDSALFSRYANHVKHFKQMIDSLDDTELLYMAFRFTSAEAHASLELARQESIRQASPPEPRLPTDLAPAVVVTLCAVAVYELGNVTTLAVEGPTVLEQVGSWAAANGVRTGGSGWQVG